MGFSRQEYRSGVPLPSPGDLPDPGMELKSPAFRQILYHLSHQGREYYEQLYVHKLENLEKNGQISRNVQPAKTVKKKHTI